MKNNLDQMMRHLKELESVGSQLGGDIGKVNFDPNDPQIIETAIAEIEQKIDNRVDSYPTNDFVEGMVTSFKEQARKGILARAAQARLQKSLSSSGHTYYIQGAGETVETTLEEEGLIKEEEFKKEEAPKKEEALKKLNNAILDFQAADYNTYKRPLQHLAAALSGPTLKNACDELTSHINLDEFLDSSENSGETAGSAHSNWPDDIKKQLGLAIRIIERGAEDPQWFLSFANKYYYYCYGNRRLVSGLRKITTSVIIPFGRDFATFVEGQ